jgi:hypothetical protein
MLKIDINNIDDQYLSDNLEDIADQGKLYYMRETLETIRKVDIKNFNYIVFEEDLDNMYKSEFQEFFIDQIVPLIHELQEYLFIDVDAILDEPYRVKQLFVKNIIRFFMNTLPYIYMKEYIHSSGAEGLHDALALFDDNIGSKIVHQIESSKDQYQNFNTTMLNIEETITNDKKKNKFSEMLVLLDHNMNSKVRLLDYYSSIISNSGSIGLKALFKQYVKNDIENIL